MSNTDTWSPIFTRLALGIVMIVHGAGKLFGAGPSAMPISDFAGAIAGIGFPAASVLAWLAALIEFGGGILVLVGLFTRYAALGIALNMLIATAFVHLPNGFSNSGGGYEYTLVLLLLALALVVSGSGKLSVTQIFFDGEPDWPLSAGS
ncbi:DoxX family protein [Halocatena marina]|uniref:DoxX family protein n=1 Tax=Halocatena marina TaxID=2934937 RepID=UPI00200C2B24|nr:DoxX family protein [Halocatena marina]